MALPGLHDEYVHIHPLLAIREQACVFEEGNRFNLEQVVDALKTCLTDETLGARSEGDWITLNKQQMLSIESLLDAYTINGARALRQDDITGSLEVGKKADIVIINQDIIAAAADAVENYPQTAYSICDKGTYENCMTKVEYTIMDGEIVYRSQ